MIIERHITWFTSLWIAYRPFRVRNRCTITRSYFRFFKFCFQFCSKYFSFSRKSIMIILTSWLFSCFYSNGRYEIFSIFTNINIFSITFTGRTEVLTFINIVYEIIPNTTTVFTRISGTWCVTFFIIYLSIFTIEIFTTPTFITLLISRKSISKFSTLFSTSFNRQTTSKLMR